MNWKNLLSFVLKSGLIIISYYYVLFKELSRKNVFCILWVKQEYTVMKLKVWDILWN